MFRFYVGMFIFTLQTMILRSLLYIIALILIAGWALGYFLWRPGPFIHVMALLAVVSLLLGITRKEGIR